MDLFTIQLSKWYQARQRGITMLDTTVKTGTSIFKPTWEMVMGLKYGNITWDQYVQLYYEKMNASWKSEEKSVWLATIQETDPIAIACMCRYEGPHTQCHRFLLKDLFEKLCASRNIEFRYYGELTD